jgi:hypothetical protein
MSATLLEIFWVVDFIACLLGILMNILLLVVIIKSANGKLQKYSYSFLITASFDTMVAVIEILTAHVSLVFGL